MTSVTTDSRFSFLANDWRFAVIGFVALLVFAIFTYVFQYRDGFAEYDSYWIITGLLDGASTNLKTSSSMQYAITVCFGFYETFYAFFDRATLTDPARLTVVINNLGWVSAVIAVAALWFAISLVEDRRTATIVAVLFSLNAVFLEASTSGHPFLFAFALLFLGACFLWAPMTGWAQIACLVVAGILFSYSLAVRADGILAFPWLVLMRPNLGSAKRFVITSMFRAAPLVFAIILFFTMQSLYAAVPHGPGAVQGSKNALIDFFQVFYRLSRIGTGLVYMGLTVGIATTLATLVAGGLLVRRMFFTPDKSERAYLIGGIIGIAALLIPNMLFWLPNPVPPRHFSLSVIGFGLCLAIFARRYNFGPALVAVLLAAIISANETLSELARPRLLERMVTTPPDVGTERLTHPVVSLGFVWRHHRSLQAATTIQHIAAEQLAATCNRKIVFTSGNGGLSFTWIPAFFRTGQTAPRLSWGKTGNFSDLTIHRDGRDVILAFSYEYKMEYETLKRLYPDAVIVQSQKASDVVDLLKQVPREDCSERRI